MPNLSSIAPPRGLAEEKRKEDSREHKAIKEPLTLMIGSSNMMLSTVNSCTAQIMGDTERPKETDTSNSRRLCRFLLTVVAIMGLTVILTSSLLNQPPKRSQRMWIKKEDLCNATGFLDRMALKLNSVEWKCPCKAMDVVAVPRNEARLVEFFLLNANNSDNVIHVNSIEQFCSEVNSRSYFSGFNATCHKLLRESFRLSGWNLKTGSSSLYMNSLRMGSLNPIAFMFDVCTSWAGGLSQASSFFLISNMGMKEEEAQRLNTFLQAIRTSLETCSRHTRWPPPEHDVYLAEAIVAPHPYKTRTTHSEEGFGYVLAISFNWMHYFTMCAPSYCEQLQDNSALWMLFAALAQVGGFVSVTLFALRSVIWPLFCMLFGWPTSFEKSQVKECNSKEQQKG